MGNRETYIYYSACAALWGILDVDEYMSETFGLPDLVSRESYSKIQDVVVWLLDELSLAEERGDVEKNKAQKLCGEGLEDFSDQIIFDWAKTILEASQDVVDQSHRSRGEILHYLLLQVQGSIMTEWCKTIESFNSRRLATYYESGKKRLNDLATWLQKEIVLFEMRNDVSAINDHKIQSLVHCLMNDWHARVDRLAQSITE